MTTPPQLNGDVRRIYISLCWYVYVGTSRMFGIKISGDIYQCVRYGIVVILRSVTSPNPATGLKYDVIKMAAKLETFSELYVI